MLQREALTAALPLTEVLDSKGLYLEPVEGTILEALVHATRSGEQFATPITTQDGQPPTGFNPDLDSIEYMANKVNDATGINEHNLVVDEGVPVAANAVRQHLAFARQVVAPLVADLARSTEDAYAALTPSSLLRMEVIQHTVPAPLLVSSFESSARRFESMAYDNPPLRLAMPDQDYAQLLELVKTGSSATDKAVEEWLALKGEAFLLNVWEQIFQVKPGVGEGKSFRDHIDNRETGEEVAIAVYLLSNQLFEAGPLEGTQMSLRDFEQLIVEYRNQSGLRLVRAFEEIREIEKNGVLVRDYTPNTVTVNSTVYRQWISEGGKNEILFGNLMEQPPLTTVANINDKAQKLAEAWSRQANIVAATEVTKKVQRMKQLLNQNFERQLKDAQSEDGALLDVQGLFDTFRAQVEMLSLKDLEHLDTTCLRLVCRTRFANTRAEFILNALEEAMCANPNLTVREAAAVATIRYIAHWVGAQTRTIG